MKKRSNLVFSLILATLVSVGCDVAGKEDPHPLSFIPTPYPSALSGTAASPIPTAAPALKLKVTVSTLAGGEVPGMQNGTGANARFNAPGSMAIDAAGNLFVLDSQNRAIRKISPAGMVSAFASNLSGDGESGIGTDAAGNVYFVPGGSFRMSITRFSSNGESQSYQAFFGDGKDGTREAFDHAMGGISDPAGNVYVADSMNSFIDRISPNGQATRIAGGGLDGISSLSSPISIAIASDGTLFSANRGDDGMRILKIAGGQVSVLAEGVAQYPGTGGALAIDGVGNLYYADTVGHRIQMISPQGVVSTLAGMGTAGFGDGSGETAQFNQPCGLAVDNTGNVYVADSGNHRIRKISPN